MIRLLVILACVFNCGAAFSQSGEWQSFVRPPFVLLDSASGDIDRDGRRDMILVLKHKNEELYGDTTRPLLLLRRLANGYFSLVGRNDNVVLCRNCGGVFGDPHEGVTIKNGYFSVEHYGGSRFRWTRIITFRYDTRQRKFMLHKDAGVSYDNTDPDKKAGEDTYRKNDFGKVAFTEYDNRKDWR